MAILWPRRPPSAPGQAEPDLPPPPTRGDPGYHAWIEREEPWRFRRIVANPFLAVAGLLAWGVALRWALVVRRLDAAAAVVLAAPLLAWLLQYHCLDCGATGVLHRWRDHDCWKVRLRREFGAPRRLVGLGPWMQAILWLAIAGLALVVGRLRR